ncbi:OadG family protein [Bacteroidales bacterium OttesenSCG-928-K03]|nr:OadG family protein [Odoribacter sp. OttesenSCG-928-L07]MDL2239292.1 OadG family protein [Bacteroidales bacterium OttesenSCG-928-L14]MDL2243092.1 OadG family protein [Bacteroidales bacterium OttesenSCG-928-K03]
MNILAITWDWSAFDSLAISIGVIGILVVFLALLFLAGIFYLLPVILDIKVKNIFKKSKPTDVVEDTTKVNGEVCAAISAALDLYFNDLHDPESNVLTINNKEVKRLSPWSDKHQFLNQKIN